MITLNFLVTALIVVLIPGNFRLLHRLGTEIQRILQINELQTAPKK